ncbi:cytochrome P450 [Burkholderia mayonis]|uniref:Cytochrome P450 n=1 Tax=Burkholderia mayonis TaxID=1385591 RepID=A0A1B4FLG2_9BURK|nr:cytochrome P450 [Burkholderia mayonis]AOJ04497.1 cytochrome P450 [Burkholderia mayonis]KVE40964.1 cytochrome P450 [Burkholderia mayonis]
MLLNPLNRRVREQQGMPVMAGAFPVLGHLPAVMSSLTDLLRYAEQRHGTHFWLEMGTFGRMLVCTQPEAFALFKNKHVLTDLLGEVAPPLKDTMATQDGDSHRSTRAWANPAFQPQGLTGAKVGDLFADIMLARIGQWPVSAPIRLVDEVSDMSLTMIFRMLGVDEQAIAEWTRFYSDYFLVSAWPVDLPGTRFRRSRHAQTWIDANLQTLIDDARARPDAGGLLAMLVHSIVSSNVALTDASLLANLRALIHAAHKTTAVTMAQLVIKIAQHPEYWALLCAEAKSIGEVPRNPANLVSFPYAEALFRETLRYHPAFPLALRRTEEAIDLGGRSIEAGTRFIIPLVLLSRNAELYPQPDVFMPGRWMGRNEGLKPIDTMQFGNGPHRCLGYHTAWMQLVQFAVALALTLSARGVRPRLVSSDAGRHRFFPLTYPPRTTRIAFE